MKLFQHSSGFVIAFGFDMIKRCPDPRMICWNDPASGDWEAAATNQAGAAVTPFDMAPEFVHESAGKVVAYQPGKCIEMTLIGRPYIWSMRTLLPDATSALRAA
jgi:hypothetical protein